MAKSSKRISKVKEHPTSKIDPRYRQIVRELEGRIESGQLAPGDRVPSTRQITKEWNVAMATAQKVLSTLQLSGAIETVPRVGAVVAAAKRASRSHARSNVENHLEASESGDLTRDRIVDAAIIMADGEGIQALSMRGLAAKLSAPPMSLYRHVRSKEDLVLLMVDEAFGRDPPPRALHKAWRSRIASSARRQWQLYRAHPWLAQVVTLTRPAALPNVIGHADWLLGALEGLGLDALTRMHVHIIVFSYVRGIAVNLDTEKQTEAETGVTDEEWVASQIKSFENLMASGNVPSFATLLRDLAGGFDLDLDEVFEFGLEPMLDGLEALIRKKGASSRSLARTKKSSKE